MILYKFMLLAALTASTQVAMPNQASGGPRKSVVASDPIPDLEACKALFLVLSDGPNPMSSRVDRQSLLTSSGLSAAEIGIVIDSANQYRIYVDQAIRRNQEILASRRKGAPLLESTMVALDGVQDEHNDLTRRLVQSLERELGPASASNLRQFLRVKIKPGMTYQPGTRR